MKICTHCGSPSNVRETDLYWTNNHKDCEERFLKQLDSLRIQNVERTLKDNDRSRTI